MRHVALLRAVNLAGHNKVPMEKLRTLLTDLGFEEPRSLLQSGNLVFDSKRRSTATLERLLEREAETRLGLATDFFVRTPSEWKAIVEDNPFPEEAECDPARLLVMTLKDAPIPEDVSKLREAIRGREVVRPGSRHVYVVYPDGVAHSKLTNSVIERHLGTRATGRNWNTARKILALVQERGGG